jgi:murein tripeptide amidase MpaA
MVGPFNFNFIIVWSMGYLTYIRSFSAGRNLILGRTTAFAAAKNPGLSSTTTRPRTARSAKFLPFSSKISISDAYDGGRIELVDIKDREGGNGDDDRPSKVVSLRIKPDPYTELEKKSHLQYFSFRSSIQPTDNGDDSDDKGVPVTYEIVNAAETSYADAWRGYTVFHSKSVGDPDSWRREPSTRYEDGKLVWKHVHTKNMESVYFSYFPPFSYARHLDLVEKCSEFTDDVFSLGQTLEGREIECIKVGTGKSVGWIIHRQHPGEHMAEFYAEGLLGRLLGLNSSGDTDGLVRQLLSKYTFYIVPSMNPDGATAGHLRVNAGGANLNREWYSSGDEYSAPSLERSPEVYHVLEKMKKTGCDVFCDIHGDEEIPYNFLAQPVVPNWGPRLQALHGAFNAAYSRANPDMNQEFAYEPTEYAEGDVLNIANDQVAHRFDCLSVTLEMPFKDCWSNSDVERGWSPARSRALGASLCEPLLYIHPYLRVDNQDEETFANSFPEEDRYVLPTSEYNK